MGKGKEIMVREMTHRIPEKFELRETRNENGDIESRTISGYAIRFNEDSMQMYGWLTERIAPSCVTADFLKEQDIKMTLFHNREKLLARNDHGDGTLRLAIDEKGLKFEFNPANDEFGRFCVEHIERGDLSGCSFAFLPEKYEWDERGEDDIHLTHTEFKVLSELTIGTDPAYPSTTVECREFAKRAKEEHDSALKAAIEKERAQKRGRMEMRLRLLEIENNNHLFN